jgi:hypothetical protein
MNTKKKLVLLTVGGAILAASAVTALVNKQEGPIPALPEQTVAAWDILYAQPFILDEGYTHYWRLEQPIVDAGYIVVLAVDPDLAVPRQTDEPVLYAGEQTVERVNTGQDEGHLVALIPALRGLDGLPDLDLASAPIWFGTPELPERVDAARIQAELSLATSEGAIPMAATRIQAALTQGGSLLHAANRPALDFYLADLIERFAPQEVDLISGMRAPLIK